MRPKRKQDKHTGRNARAYRTGRYKCCGQFDGNAEKPRNRKMCSQSLGYFAKWNKLAAKNEICEWKKTHSLTFDYSTGIAEYDGEHLRVLPPSFK